MKHVALTIGLSLLVASPALGLTYLGTPTTNMKAGQVAGGASYADSRQDVELEGGIDIEDVDEESTLGRLAIGIFDERMEIFGLFGAAELGKDDIETDEDFFFGFGTRITTNLGDDLDWGIVGQFTWFNNEDDADINGVLTPYDLNVIDVQVAFGPCWRPGPFIAYGGPMFQWITGDVESPILGKRDVNAESLFGGYVGGGIELAEHLSVTGEVQATPDAHAWAVSVQWRF